MKKNLAILLLICLSAIASWAGSTNDAIENLNRKLPLDSNTDRLLSKMIYDEVNNIVIANYYTSWQNLVQMRKTSDFNKRAGEEVLENIFIEDSAVKPFTLIVNYFADESGFEDLAKTYFVSPGQVANAQKAFLKNSKNPNNKNKEQPSTKPQPQEPDVAAQALLDQQLQRLSSRLADFKGYTDPQARFKIGGYVLSQDKKDINIVIVAREEAMPFFIDEQYSSRMEESINRRLSQEFPDLENIFNTLGLNIAIYTADTKGQIKGQYKYPASKVFANNPTSASSSVDQANGKGKDKDKDKSKKKKNKDKDKGKAKTEDVSEQNAVQVETPALTQPSAASDVQTQTPTPNAAADQQPSAQTQPSSQSQQPAQQTTQTGTSAQTTQTQGSQNGDKTNTTNEQNFQALIKLYQALMPQKIADGVKLSQIKADDGHLMLVVEVDSEKYPESEAPQVRNILLKHLATEFGKKKSPFPLLLSLSCQTSRQFIYVISSKGWKSTYPVPLDPCNVLQSLKEKVGK